ncbi:hypothetical protein IAT40_005848 [Kwoniella sp. CBS 6097]
MRYWSWRCEIGRGDARLVVTMSPPRIASSAQLTSTGAGTQSNPIDLTKGAQNGGAEEDDESDEIEEAGTCAEDQDGEPLAEQESDEGSTPTVALGVTLGVSRGERFHEGPRDIPLNISAQDPSPSDPPTVIQSPSPVHVQTYYCNHTRSNRSNIDAMVDKLLGESADKPLQRLPERGDLLIPRPARSGGPKYWVIRLSGQLSQSDQDKILDAVRAGEKAGSQAFIKGTERTAGLSPHHLGILFRASGIEMPWVTNDTLQPHSKRKVQAERRQCMLEVCLAIGSVTEERVQTRLSELDHQTWLRHQASTQRIRAAVENDKLDLRGLSLNDVPEDEVDHVSDFFRFGRMATCSAITQGQSEKMHLDSHDDRSLYTTLLVLGRKDRDWDHTDGRGDLLLPTLGVALPVFPGDVVFFQPGLLPHLVKALKPEDAKKRVVITMFTCELTTDYLDMQGIELELAESEPAAPVRDVPRLPRTMVGIGEEEMEGTGLVVCTCGKVAVSERGLALHRSRYPDHHA